MKIISMNEWLDLHANFLTGRSIEAIFTSPFTNNSYSKHYICEKGFELWEQNTNVVEEVETQIEIYGIPMIVKVNVKLVKHEMWNTKDSSSYVAYERI